MNQLRWAVFAACLSVIVPASAAAPQRTFVASMGNDSNPCSLVLPCRGFAVAVAVVAPGGEVIVLDSAGYGPVIIDKAVSLTAPAGVYAGITVPDGANGIVINAGDEDNVTLRGLTIVQQGAGPGIGILQSSGRLLTVDRCTVSGNGSTSGVAIAHGNFLIRNSMFEGLGIAISGGVPAGLELGPQVLGTVTDSTIHDVDTGIHVGSRVNLFLANSVIVGKATPVLGPVGNVGVDANANGSGSSNVHVVDTRVERFAYAVAGNGIYQTANITVVNSDLSLNDTAVICGFGGNASISLSNVRVTHNQQGIATSPGTCTTVYTSGTNYFRDNMDDGLMMGPVGIK